MVVPNNRAKRRNIQPSKDRLTAFGPFIAMMGEDMLSTQTLRRLREAGVYDKKTN